MVKKFLFLSLVSTFFLFWAGLAAAQTVTIENNTASAINQLYISNSDTQSWEEDVLGGDVLESGASVNVSFGRAYMMYDLLAIFDNGAEHIYDQINIREVSSIILNAEDAELY